MNRRKLLLMAAAGASTGLLKRFYAQPEPAGLIQALGSNRGLLEVARLNSHLPTDQTSLQILAGIDATDSVLQQVQSFAAKRREDFREGRTRTVNGWLLTEAECALCALVSLS